MAAVLQFQVFHLLSKTSREYVAAVQSREDGLQQHQILVPSFNGSNDGPASACMNVLRSVVQEGNHCSNDTGAGVLLVQAETLRAAGNSPLLKAVEMVAAYTSSSFGVGYFGSLMDRPKVTILRSTGKTNRSEINHFAARIDLNSEST